MVRPRSLSIVSDGSNDDHLYSRPTPPPSARRRRHQSSDKENNPNPKTPYMSTQRSRRGGGLCDPTPSQVSSPGIEQLYNPNQPLVERRAVRSGYRDLGRQLDENRTEYLKQDNQGLVDIYETADGLFRNVKQTTDATLDSRILVAAADLTLKRIQGFNISGASNGLDVDLFVGKCLSFMRNNGGQQVRDEDDDDHQDWARLGRVAAFPGTKRPATSDFLLGPLAVQKKVRVQAKRKQGLGKRRLDDAKKPMQISQEQVEQNETGALHQVRKVYDLLEEHMSQTGLEELGLFEVVINPQSFSQTVENIFYVSFLVKEGKLALYDNEDGLPVIALALPATDDERNASNLTRKQMIFNVTMHEWKQYIEVFDLKQSIIPTRPKQKGITANGWYGT